MLFVPGMAPFDQDRQMGKSRNIRLYVKRVFISGAHIVSAFPLSLGAGLQARVHQLCANARGPPLSHSRSLLEPA